MLFHIEAEKSKNYNKLEITKTIFSRDLDLGSSRQNKTKF